ncbi:MAG: GNAT family N-acetyltransferase [Anaerolineales bacterium]
MMQIVPCKDHIEELVQFATRLNSDDAHHIGFFGEGEADVRSSLAESLIPTADGFLLAYEDERLVGVFGIDADPAINRAWLFGPLVEHADWHSYADALYAEVLNIIPAGIQDRDLFCDVQNIHMDEFALRHDFPVHSENALMTLLRERYIPAAKRTTCIVPFEETWFGQFEPLHKTLFPNGYFTPRQMVEKINETHRLFLAVENERLLGYHFCKIDPDAESGYVDFIGTDESARGRGVGADLLASGVDWMLSAVSTRKINLTVNSSNLTARRLYEKFGFGTERVMRGYRKHVA